MPNLTATVAREIRAAPSSMGTLARSAGVSVALLSRITSGERTATPAVAEAVARALEHWSADCLRAARRIRKAAQPRRAR